MRANADTGKIGEKCSVCRYFGPEEASQGLHFEIHSGQIILSLRRKRLALRGFSEQKHRRTLWGKNRKFRFIILYGLFLPDVSSAGMTFP
jgi:hypothetical protein